MSNDFVLAINKPPSPEVIALRGCSENEPKSPNVPTCFPLYVAPSAHAASSITKRECFFAILIIDSISQASPNSCTGIIALVLVVIAFSILVTSILKLSRSTSTNIGVAPTSYTTLAVAM